MQFVVLSYHKKRFGHKDVIINTHIEILLNLETIINVNNTSTLRKLYENIGIQIRPLNVFEVTSVTYGTRGYA